MKGNIYWYIFVMAGVTYLIRVLPLTLIRKPIKNKWIRSFLYYVSLRYLGSDDIPGNPDSHLQRMVRGSRASGGFGPGVFRGQLISGGCGSLWGGVFAGAVFIKIRKTEHIFDFFGVTT